MAMDPNCSVRSSFVQRLLHVVVAAVIRFPRTTLLITGIFAACSIYLAFTKLTFLTQRNDLVSPHKEYQQRWQQYVSEFGDDADMVVVVRGDDRKRMKQALEDLNERLRNRPQLFDRIFYKVDLRTLRGRALLFLPLDELRQIQANLKSMKQLLEPPVVSLVDPLFGWKQLTLGQLLGETERRLRRQSEQTDPNEKEKQLFQQVQAISDSAALMVKNPDNYRNPWRSLLPPQEQKDLLSEPQFFFSDDGSLAFLLVRPAKNLSSFTSAEAAIAKVRQILEQMKDEHAPLQFGLTGLPVLEHDEMTASRADTTSSSWLALTGVALLYLLVYRCLRYPLLTLSTLMIGMVLTLGWLTLTVGHLNILSATFAVMLIGLGDYGVLWITRYEQERAEGHAVTAAIAATTRHIGPSIITATVTTALAFFTAILIDFRAVAELGWIAGSGVLLCALSCFTFLPALVFVIDRKHDRVARMRLTLPLPTSWLPIVTRRPAVLLACAAPLLAIFGYFALQVRYDHNLLHLQAGGLESVKWELTLIERTAGASWHALSTAKTAEEARAKKKRLEKLACVSHVVEVGSLIPAGQVAKLPLLEDVNKRLRHLPEKGKRIRQQPPKVEALLRQIDRCLAAMQPLGAAYAPLRTSLQKLRNSLRAVDGPLASNRLHQFQANLTRDLAEDLRELRSVSQPLPITTADLPQSLSERYVGKSGMWLLRIFGKGSLWEYGPLQKFVGELRQADAGVTGKPVSTLEGLQAMFNGFKWACIYAFCAMVVVLLLDFRSVAHASIALAPLAVGMLLTMGLLGLFRIPLNPANMIALPLILGVGADNGVHIVHDYVSRRRGKPYYLSRSTGRGILVAALTTIFGFGTLMISRHRGLSGLGMLLTIGVSSCLITALVLLPAFLRLLTSKQKSAAPVPPAETPVRKAA